MSNKVTMKDIAEKLNISINAVSLALNNKFGVSDETRAKVLKTADEMNYFDRKPKYLNTFSNKNICLVLEHRFLDDQYFYFKVILGMQMEAKKNNYDIIMSFVDEDNYLIPSCIKQGKVSSIIVLGPLKNEYILKLKKFGLPMVLVDNCLFLEPIDSILTNNMLGTYSAVSYLVKKGFTKLGFIGDLSYSRSIQERYFGFYEAIKDFKLYENSIEEYIETYSLTSKIEEIIIDNNINVFVEKLKQIKKLPQAFICSNDNAAIILNNALKLLKYNVPEDVSIIGFDDIYLCNMTLPKLTSIRVNKELMGRKAVKRLIWRLNHKDEPSENIRLSVELVERESVKDKIVSVKLL